MPPASRWKRRAPYAVPRTLSSCRLAPAGAVFAPAAGALPQSGPAALELTPVNRWCPIEPLKPRLCRPSGLRSLIVVNISGRTSADDDVLLSKLHSLAQGGYEGPHSSGCRPDRLFPPVSMAQVEQAERQLGYRLPVLLRRIYTEIGDGGFGPEAGLASLTPRRVPDRPESECLAQPRVTAHEPSGARRRPGSS